MTALSASAATRAFAEHLVPSISAGKGNYHLRPKAGGEKGTSPWLEMMDVVCTTFQQEDGPSQGLGEVRMGPAWLTVWSWHTTDFPKPFGGFAFGFCMTTSLGQTELLPSLYSREESRTPPCSFRDAFASRYQSTSHHTAFISLKMIWGMASRCRAGGSVTQHYPLHTWQNYYFRARMCSESLPAAQNPGASQIQDLPLHAVSYSRDSLSVALPKKPTTQIRAASFPSSR